MKPASWTGVKAHNPANRYVSREYVDLPDISAYSIRSGELIYDA